MAELGRRYEDGERRGEQFDRGVGPYAGHRFPGLPVDQQSLAFATKQRVLHLVAVEVSDTGLHARTLCAPRKTARADRRCLQNPRHARPQGEPKKFARGIMNVDLASQT